MMMKLIIDDFTGINDEDDITGKNRLDREPGLNLSYW